MRIAPSRRARVTPTRGRDSPHTLGGPHPRLRVAPTRASSRGSTPRPSYQVPEAIISALYSNAYKALKPGGRLLVHDFMVDDSMDGPPLGALWALQHVTVNADGLGTPAVGGGGGGWPAALAVRHNAPALRVSALPTPILLRPSGLMPANIIERMAQGGFDASK